jgi:hypothetical protein
VSAVALAALRGLAGVVPRGDGGDHLVRGRLGRSDTCPSVPSAGSMSCPATRSKGPTPRPHPAPAGLAVHDHQSRSVVDQGGDQSSRAAGSSSRTSACPGRNGARKTPRRYAPALLAPADPPACCRDRLVSSLAEATSRIVETSTCLVLPETGRRPADAARRSACSSEARICQAQPARGRPPHVAAQ